MQSPQSPSEGGTPPGFEPSGMSFEEAMASALAEMPRGEADSAVEERPAPPPAEPVKTAPAPVVEQPAPTAPSNELAGLMAREAALIEQQKALRTEREQHDSYLRDLQARLDKFEDAQKRFRTNPAAYVRTLAPDLPPNKLAERLWFDELGDLAPAEHRLEKEVLGTKTELQQLRDEISAERQRLVEEQARMQREQAMKQVVVATPDENRLLKSLASKNPDLATRMLLDADRMAKSQGRELAPAEAAQLVEQYLSQFEGVFTPPAAPAPVQPDPKASPAPTSLRNEHTRVQPSLTPESPDDPNVKRRRALEAAGFDPNDPSFRALFD